MNAKRPFDLSSKMEQALDANDSVIEELTADERKIVGASWLHRAESEMTAAVGFADLANDLFVEPAAPGVRWLTVRAAADEMRHSEICRRVAERYLGSPPSLPPPRRYESARFGDCPEPVNRSLRVVMQSCFSETIGSAALKTLLDRARGPVVRAALRELLRDEIDHARIGYAHLSSGLVSANHKDHIRRALPTLLEVTRGAWLAESSSAPQTIPPGHGCFSCAEVREVVEDAIQNLVMPGMAAVL
jgi:hypothetical protein